MKYKVDTKWGMEQAIETALNNVGSDVRYQRICTSGGRQILFILADAPANANVIYTAVNVDLWRENLRDSRGLCTMLYQKPVRNTCLISATYDGIIGVFATDMGFRRGQKSMATTAVHEAVHAGQRLAAKELGIAPNNTGVFTKEHEELTAQWTGYLAVEFLNAMRTMTV